MIARIWHGMTEASKADAYLAFVRKRAIPEYRSVPGNQGAFVLRRIDGDRAHFLTLSFWTSLEAVRGFAGDDVEQARYFPEDEGFLLEFEPAVQHYELYDTES
jgi:heme-degrading monooxygenase HmoA